MQEKLGLISIVYGLIAPKIVCFMSNASIYVYVAMQEVVVNADLKEGKDEVFDVCTGLVVGSDGASPHSHYTAVEGMKTKGLRGVGLYAVTKSMASGVALCLARHHLKLKVSIELYSTW